TLTTVTLPAGLTSIGPSALDLCSSLASVNLPAGLTSICRGAFFGCSSLTRIAFPAGLTSIGDYAFLGCSALTTVTLPAGLTSISEQAFFGCSALGSVTFPAGLTSIGKAAFCRCSSIARVTLPAGLTFIGSLAFALCSSLTRVTVLDTATIGDEAFNSETTVLRLSPASMRDLQRWYEAVDGALANKRCRPLLYGWLERAQDLPPLPFRPQGLVPRAARVRSLCQSRRTPCAPDRPSKILLVQVGTPGPPPSPTRPAGRRGARRPACSR
ncbi:hypothetical protein EMIHUDRAFT_73203, partial [Emiliania huxleyi CCMP1516]|uniref:Surface antigen-like protein n=2 Tax=Emiliania huxleyi TaxID=2903 RepID=A0A0D3JWZ9_EMIH1